MSLIHDILKIKYVREGYLPYYPYHLISDEEMFCAFILNDECAFDYYYPEPSDCCEKVVEAHRTLKEFIKNLVIVYVLNHYDDALKDYEVDETINDYFTFSIDEIPDWVYTYMLGEVIGPNSEELDKHDFFTQLNDDNLYDEFEENIYLSILAISNNLIAKVREEFSGTVDSVRVSTIYGEPSIIYQLRIEDVGI